MKVFAALGAIVLTASLASAHHSFDAEYDSKKPITVTGFVTKLDWVNPHAYVYLDVKDDSGAVKNYKIEMGPPYALARGGWKRETVSSAGNSIRTLTVGTSFSVGTRTLKTANESAGASLGFTVTCALAIPSMASAMTSAVTQRRSAERFTLPIYICSIWGCLSNA